MRRIVCSMSFGRLLVFVVLLLAEACLPVVAQTAEPEGGRIVLTNLSQLLASVVAEQQTALIHPLRVVADVYDVDVADGVLLLRDASGFEFVKLDLQGQSIQSGDTVCLEGHGCGVKLKNFGLSIIPGLVVDNDGVHGMALASGTVFLHAGAEPIKLQWFNRIGAFGLTVEYEGPDLPRKQIEAADLTRDKNEPCAAASIISIVIALWGYLPDFTKFPPVENWSRL